MKHPLRENGFTLIELLLYIAIVGSLLMGVTTFFALTAESRIKNQSISEVNQQGTLAMEYITNTIRNASGIYSPAAGSTDNQLTLDVPTGSLSRTIFNLNSEALQVKEGAATAIPLTNNKVQVTSLSVKNLTKSGSPGLVQISFTVSRVNAANRNEYEYQKDFITSAALRRP